jgi:NADH:ubiquinone reductase (H+-translocating)
MPVPELATPDDAPHVVVVGGGFAGLAAVRRLADAATRMPLRVTLVDRHNHHTFQPLLYQAATASLEPHSIGQNLRSELRGLPVEVLYATVTGVDVDGKRLRLEGEDPLPYDVLLLAAGAETASYGIDGVEEHAFPLKWLSQATALRNHILATFERLDAAWLRSDPGERDRSEPTADSTFVIAGAGPTGVELAGALAELIRRVIGRDHPGVRPEGTRVVLVEMADEVLPPFRSESRAYVQGELEARGVEVRTGTAIEEVGPDFTRLDDGEVIPTRTVIWTAGVQANPLAASLDAEQTGGGRLVVDPDLRLSGRDDVFVTGDLAGATDEAGDLLPQVAPVAIQQGRHAALQAVRHLRGKPTEPFRYEDKGQMVTIGRHAAVAELAGDRNVYGAPGWLAWLGLHLLTLAGFRNRVSVLMNWSYNYAAVDRAARLILPPPHQDQGG